jgi:hypothetical protein
MEVDMQDPSKALSTEEDSWVIDVSAALRLLLRSEPDSWTVEDRCRVLAVMSTLVSSTQSFRNHVLALMMGKHSVSSQYGAENSNGLVQRVVPSITDISDGNYSITDTARQAFIENLDFVSADSSGDGNELVCYFSGITSSILKGTSEKWVYVPKAFLHPPIKEVSELADERPICTLRVLLRIAASMARTLVERRKQIVQLFSTPSLNVTSSYTKVDLSEDPFLRPESEKKIQVEDVGEGFATYFVGMDGSNTSYWVLGRQDVELLSLTVPTYTFTKEPTSSDQGSSEVDQSILFDVDRLGDRRTNAAVLIKTASPAGTGHKWSMVPDTNDALIGLIHDLRAAETRGDDEKLRSIRHTIVSKLSVAHANLSDGQLKMEITQQDMMRKMRKAEGYVMALVQAALVNRKGLDDTALAGMSVFETMRIVDLAWSRSVEIRINMQYGDFAEESLEMFPADLANCSRLEKDRAYVQRRRIREHVLEEIMDLHPKKGWLRCGDKYFRLRTLPSTTQATKFLADAQCFEIWQGYMSGSRLRKAVSDESFSFLLYNQQRLVADGSIRASRRLMRADEGSGGGDEDGSKDNNGDDEDAPVNSDEATENKSENGDNAAQSMETIDGCDDSAGASKDAPDADNMDVYEKSEAVEDGEAPEGGKTEDEDEVHKNDDDDSSAEGDVRPRRSGRARAVKSYRDVDEDEDEGGRRKRSKIGTDSAAVTATPETGKNSEIDLRLTASSTRGLGSGCMSFNTVRRKRIEQLHIVTGEVLRRYDSGSEAAAFMEISQSGISLCCMGKKLDSNGFRWRFYDGKFK